MQDFRKRRNRKAELLRIVLRSLGVVALAALAFMLMRGSWGMYERFAAASEARAIAENRLAELEGRYEKVQTQVAALNSARGVEQEIRQRYGVVKPGEGEIDIVRVASSSNPAGAAPQGWWDKLRSIFDIF